VGNNNLRILEQDIMSSAQSDAAGGDSSIIDLNGALRFSCQATYDVLSYSAAAVASTDVTLSSDVTNPSSFMKAAHGLITGLKVQIATSSTLPIPFVAITDYFIIATSANYFQLATTLVNAQAGTAVAITNVGVGTQTITAGALAGASVTFNRSNDRVNWLTIQAATTVTVDGGVMIEQANVSYRWFKVTKAVTAGAFDLIASTLVIGDGE